MATREHKTYTEAGYWDEKIDDLLNHLVLKEGTGPNGSSGTIEFWKNGERITAHEAIKRLLLSVKDEGSR